MFTPKISPQLLCHQSRVLKANFSLLCWNIHKENNQLRFDNKLQQLLQLYPSDLLVFQEVKQLKSSSCSFADYSYAMATNMESSRHVFGVLTAAKTSFEQISPLLSQNKELSLFTHKSLLISYHRQANQQLLCLVNVHAINFVSLASFSQELDYLIRQLLDFTGAIVIAGDFNSWSAGRMKALASFQQVLKLQRVDFKQPQHIKRFFSKPLDHVFYRGLTLDYAQAINSAEVSDHNPIYVRFKAASIDVPL